MKKAQKEANTDASVAVSTAVSERACVCVSTADLPKPWACTEKTEQLSFCNIYITLHMFVKLQKKFKKSAFTGLRGARYWLIREKNNPKMRW